MRVRVRGLKRYRDRHGNWRVYHRKSGTAIDPSLTGEELAAEVDRLNKIHAPKVAKAGTLGGLLESYKKSPRFTDLAPRTRADYHKYMNHLHPIRDTPLTLLTPGFVAKLRDKTIGTKRAGFANHLVAMLSSACRHGVEYELIDTNPCAGLQKAKIARDRKRANRPWSAAERVNVLAAAPHHLRAPLALARFLGIRRGDIVDLPEMSYRNGWLSFTTSKTGKPMKLPALGTLAEVLDARPRGEKVTMLCVNSRGQKWTDDGLSASLAKFFAKCVKRGIADHGLTLHGLRHSVAAELRSLGYTNEQIKDYLGHDSAQMTAHYSSSADVSGALIDMANVLQRGRMSNRTKP